MIDKRLLDEIDMIVDGGDSVGATCLYAMCYSEYSLLARISNLIGYNDKRYIFWRSWSLIDGKDNQSRDHVFWLKIACKYFNDPQFEFMFNDYFKSLKPFSHISDKFRMTPDLWLFCRDYNFLWQLSLLYLIPAMVWKKIIHGIAGLKDTTPDKFFPKKRKYTDSHKKIANTFKETIKEKWVLKSLGWKFLEYLFSEIWICTYATYSVRQTAFALYVSKRIPVLTPILQWTLCKLTWKGNPLIDILTGKTPTYDISPYFTDVCGKEMNQRNEQKIEYKTPENEYKCKIYNDLINKLK